MLDAQEYEQRWLHSDQSVQVVMPQGEGDAPASQRSAVIKGLSASGFTPPLRALARYFLYMYIYTYIHTHIYSHAASLPPGFILADMQGQRVELHPDCTSMDMTQRLLYSKRL
jgi:hypothetical protein